MYKEALFGLNKKDVGDQALRGAARGALYGGGG